MSSKETKSICRGCLGPEHNMVDATLYEAMYKDLTGIIISQSGGLPQGLCYKCLALLQKCVRFRNKIIKSHYLLCKYMLENKPFVYDVNTSLHLSQTSIMHYDIPGAQTVELVEPVKNTVANKNSINHMSDNNELNNIIIKEEAVFSVCQDNMVEEECREMKFQIDVINKSTVRQSFQLDNDACTAEEQINNTIVYDVVSASNVKNGTKLFNDEKNITLEERRFEDFHNKQISDTSTRKLKHEELTTQGQSCNRAPDFTNSDRTGPVTHPCRTPVVVLCRLDVDTQVLRSESHFVTCAPRRSLRSRLRLDKNVCASASNKPGVVTQSNPADITSTLHNDDAELQVKRNSSDVSNKDNSSSNKKTYICDKCNKSFLDKILLIAHFQDQSVKKPFKCDVCCKCFSNDYFLRRHTRVHTCEKSYQCDVCLKCFHYKNHLVTHIRVHSEKPYKCKLCAKCFRYKNSVKKHDTTHTKLYKCKVCMRCFRSKNKLTIHYRIHTSDILYKCDICMKCFKRKGNLDLHYRIHTGDKPYKCDVCMKCFMRKGNLDLHYLIHMGDRPYKCDICLRCFKQKRILDIHYRIHTDERPYKCDICTKCFRRKDTLDKHYRMHTNARPYKCEICMKCFRAKYNLNIHYLLHAGKKPYKCDVCVMRCFTTNSKLRYHYNKHHAAKQN